MQRRRSQISRPSRAGGRYAADRLPAELVLGVQPAGERGRPAEHPGRGSLLGAGPAGPYHYALRSGASTSDTLPDLYAQWENWTAEVAESHTTYLPLMRFRSPRPAVVVGHGAAGCAGLGSALPRAITAHRASGARTALPAWWFRLPQPCRPGHGPRRLGDYRSSRRNQPHLRGASPTGSPICERSTSRWSGTLPTPGRTSSAGASTTSRLPTRWPTPSMPSRRCGQVREGAG
jgi:hypothetical protein